MEESTALDPAETREFYGIIMEQAGHMRRRVDPEPFLLGDLAINCDRRLVSVDGVQVDLTAKEYELLRVLSLNAGRVSTFDALIRQVWGAYGYANHKLVRSLVKSLRRKIGDDARAPDYIFNVRGIGYRMARLAELEVESQTSEVSSY